MRAKLGAAVRSLIDLTVASRLRARVDVTIGSRRLGSSYGGWVVAENTLNPRSIVYSAGVGEDISFDLALIEHFDLTVHAFDPTPRSIAWVRSQSVPPAFVLHEFGVANADAVFQLHPPDNPQHVSHSMLRKTEQSGLNVVNAPMKRLGTIMKELSHSQINLLKMDIEGAEYSVIADMLNSRIRPTQVLVEFHHRFGEIGLAATRNAIQLLRASGYKLFAVSENVEEFSFIRE